MIKNNKKVEYYGTATIKETEFHTFDCYIRVNRQTYRTRCKTKMHARAWCDSIILNNGGNIQLTQTTIQDAIKAIQILAGKCTLTDCAKFYNTINNCANPQKLSESIQLFIKDKTNRNLSPTTLKIYQHKLSELQKNTGDIFTNKITKNQIVKLLEPYTITNFNNSLRILKVFFTWNQINEIINENPTSKIKLVKMKEPPRQIISIEKLNIVLYNATQSPETRKLIPYVVLCAFAGIRPNECYKIKKSDIKEDYILLDAKITKTSNTRSVPIKPNLKAWLQAFPISEMGVNCGICLSYLRHLISLLLKKSGVTHRQDIFRHSYASYRYDQNHNAAETAFEMGHRGVDMFFKHYRALVSPGEGDKYFAITPQSVIDFYNIFTTCLTNTNKHNS